MYDIQRPINSQVDQFQTKTEKHVTKYHIIGTTPALRLPHKAPKESNDDSKPLEHQPNTTLLHRLEKNTAIRRRSCGLNL